ncbi:MAG TPA: CvpA family protein [Candidatus Saccharimonadales bacterium]|nr:CvpA family protein [Candidatus Saccharimonadales bacterium]
MINLVDLLVLILIIFLIWQGYKVGLVAGLLNLLVTVASFFLALNIYPFVADFLAKTFSMDQNIARVFAFLATLVTLEISINFFATYFYGKIAPYYRRSKPVAKLDHYLGIIPSLAIGIFFILILQLMLLTLPVKAWLRDPISESWWGRNVVYKTLPLVPTIEKTLNQLPYKSLIYIVTPQSPTSEASQNLNIPPGIKLSQDPEDEKGMWELINKERKAVGLKQVSFDNNLRDVGRAHCSDMFKRSYFSHYTPEGKSPFDRMDEAGIDYLAAGENLAYAPSLALAHQGLMNSPGHRENILRSSFGKVGVGVIDGGFYGKMFCQEFTN